MNRRQRGKKVLRRLKRSLFPRGLSFTREGKVYVVVTLGVGFAAANTGNNLLFLVLGLMLGLIITSGILSEIVLRCLQIERKVLSHVEANQPFNVELVLTNRKRKMTSFSITLRDEIDGELFKRRCYFLKLGPGETQGVSYRCQRSRRGRCQFTGTVVSTQFPFGLFEKRRFVAIKEEIIVLPERIDIGEWAAFGQLGELGATSDQAGIGQDFRELKEMANGDDPRSIHWKSSARLGRLMVKQTDAELLGLVEIVLDPSPPTPGPQGIEAAEQNIRLAGTLVRMGIDRGMKLQLVTGSRQILRASDKKTALRLLVHLALIDVKTASLLPRPTGTTPGAILIGPLGGDPNGHHGRQFSPRIDC